LFNLAWIIDGYHYAFLQPVHRVRHKRAGESLDLQLWTINPEGERCDAGRIKNCMVLTTEEAHRASATYRKGDWFHQMQEDVGAVGGDKEELGGALFNVRFRPEDVTTVSVPPLPFVTIPREIRKYARYQLVEARDRLPEPSSAAQDREGRSDLPPDDLGVEKIKWLSRTVQVDRQERRLQRRLMRLLRNEFGTQNVRREGGFGPAPFDLVVRVPKRTILIELKAYADARRAIREALGQILEYTFFSSRNVHDPKAKIELFIVAPAPVDDAVSRYMNLLRQRFAIPIHYCSFTLADSLPGAFSNADQTG
jgi:hypothetical protein